MDDNSFDLETFLPYLLNQAAEEASLGFQQVYKSKYGLLRGDWRVLFHLGIYGQLTASDIGQRARIHKTKISRAVQRLADRRLVKRETSDTDRRREFLTLTPAGEKIYRDLREVAQGFDQRLTSTLSEKEAATLRATLLKLVRNR